MIDCTVQEVRDAYRAFKRIGEETRLPQKAAWRISRLMGKMKPILADFEEAQKKLFLDAGGAVSGAGVEIRPPERGTDETDEAWDAKLKEHRDTMNRLSQDIAALTKEKAQIDYDPLPLTMLDDDDPKRAQRFSFNDLADAGPFIAEK